VKSLDGLHPVFRRRVEALLADPEAVAAGISIVSAFRSNEYQARLFAAAVKKYGSETAARKWVAPPGKSNHGPRVDGYGIAVDFGIRGVTAVSGQWPPAKELLMRRLGARYHLHSPMAWEDWHYEPIEGTRIRLDSWTPDGTTPAPQHDQHQEDDDMRLRTYVEGPVAPGKPEIVFIPGRGAHQVNADEKRWLIDMGLVQDAPPLPLAPNDARRWFGDPIPSQ